MSRRSRRSPAQQAVLAAARQAAADLARDRRTQYARLRNKGRPIAACAAWLGISERTAQRYENRLRQEANTTKGTAA